MPTNVLVFIHGITPERHPSAHTELYQDFWTAMQRERPELGGAITRVAFVEWGNAFPGAPPRPDTLLSDAERNAGDRVRFANVKKHVGPNNVLHPGPLGDWGTLPGMREIVLAPVREELVQFGLADAVYYCSSDGERAVRVSALLLSRKRHVNYHRLASPCKRECDFSPPNKRETAPGIAARTERSAMARL
jgi:hypothetical protein